MPEFRSIPELIRVNGTFVFDRFEPSQPAFSYNEYRGKKGSIYALQCEGFVKIGMSKNFASRFKQIDAGVPFDVKKIAMRSVPLAGMAYAEAWLHHKFKENRVKGEWFSIPPGEALSAMALAVRRAEIYDKHCRDWHEADRVRRLAPARQEKLKKEYDRFLEAYPQAAEL